GTFSFETGLQLVARRGAFMEEACAATAGGMAAMIGGEEDAIRALAAECGVEVANLNAPGQIVLSGPAEGIRKALAAAQERELCAAKELTVAGAYHSRLMQPAQDQLAAELAGVELHPPRFPVYSNFLAAPVSDPAEIRSSLERQVTGSVRWAGSMDRILEAGNEDFLELGPGKVLAGLMRRIRRGTKVISIGSAEDLEKLAAR
ncbi:MAG: ACP S-malonyltransferase, partial [Akkermansiaceae bacterium]|nr:ACP S-malonyltransferase [Akkermansiaceae bacterium]